MSKKKIAVIGGGASGMMAAIQAAEAGAQVTIYEKNDRIGKKILATGNGKCNFTNGYFDEHCYRGGGREIVKSVLKRFDDKACVKFFEGLGMLSHERNQYYYPASDQASTVLDVLRNKLQFLEIEIVTEFEVTELKREKKGYYISGFLNGTKQRSMADAVILAAGSIAGISGKKKAQEPYELLRKLGLSCIPVVPSLVQLRCAEDFMKSVAGVRLQAAVSLLVNDKICCREQGELQLTEYGISGIPVFQLSRYAAYGLREKKKVTAVIDCLPDYVEEAIETLISQRRVLHEKQTAEQYYLGICNRKLLLLFLKLCGIKPTEPIKKIPEKKRREVFLQMKCLQVTITATNPFEQAQVCAGGLSMSEVDENLQVKKFPGLFVTGELLDVDGRCGGYNLQWAFAGGYVAGKEAAKGNF